MAKRMHLLTVLGVLGGLASVVVIVFLLVYPSAINLENYQRLHAGMTRPEVEKLLGGGPRDETAGKYLVFWPNPASRKRLQYIPLTAKGEWIGDQCAILVVYDDECQVMTAELGCIFPRSEGWLQQLRLRLGL